MDLLAGRRGVIVGIANERSLAYSIAQAASSAGAELIVTYQNERLQPTVARLAAGLRVAAVLPCDVTVGAQVDALMAAVKGRFGALD